MSKVTRRLGSSPAERGSASGQSCPDILELADGDFLVIGKRSRVNDRYNAQRFGATVGEDEVIVKVPRRVLVDAKPDIPDE